jgi:hypothetical protein
MRRPTRVPLAILAALAALVSPMRAAPGARPASTQTTVVRSQDANINGLVAEITECRRADGVLSVKMRLKNTSDADVQVNVIRGRNFDDYYVVAGTKKYFVLRQRGDAARAGGEHIRRSRPEDSKGRVVDLVGEVPGAARQREEDHVLLAAGAAVRGRADRRIRARPEFLDVQEVRW